MLSWRDIKHPYGGGAELLSHEVAKRWVKFGHQVTHFSAAFPMCLSEELIDGVTYQRTGNWYDVHFIAFFKYLLGQLANFDVVIDEVHGIPFFAGLYRPRVICLACEVAKEVWDQMYTFPLNLIGRFLEKIYLLLYRNLKFLTISNSTAADLVRSGIPNKNITVLPMGLTYTLPSKLPPKTSFPSIIFLGRLAKSKGVADAIEAFSLIHKKKPSVKMWIVGRGIPEYENQLRSQIAKLGLLSFVKFKGFVSESEKFKLLSQARLLLAPSIREGWGLIVPEANLVGTPAVVYDVPGLRDVTKNGINGIIVSSNTPQSLANASLNLFSHPAQYQKLSRLAREYAKSMNWDDTAQTALNAIS